MLFIENPVSIRSRHHGLIVCLRPIADSLITKEFREEMFLNHTFLYQSRSFTTNNVILSGQFNHKRDILKSSD